MASTKVCESISLQCSVEVTTYGYHPSLAGNIVMVAIFAICAITQVFLGIKYRLRAYPIVVSLGCLGESNYRIYWQGSDALQSMELWRIHHANLAAHCLAPRFWLPVSTSH